MPETILIETTRRRLGKSPAPHLPAVFLWYFVISSSLTAGYKALKRIWASLGSSSRPFSVSSTSDTSCSKASLPEALKGVR